MIDGLGVVVGVPIAVPVIVEVGVGVSVNVGEAVPFQQWPSPSRTPKPLSSR